MEDLTGMVFGRLTINGFSHKKNGNGFWNCICECGNEKVINGYRLKNGNTKSCGCLAREMASKRLKKYNTYDLSREYGIGYTSKGEPFYFDLEDYEKIKEYCWHYHPDTHNSYLRTRLDVVNNKNKYNFMHRLLFDLSDPTLEVDHINGLTYDNRKENLRVVTHQQNMCNVTHNRKNTSGQMGVHYSKLERKWKVYISLNNKRIHLGTFECYEDAVNSRKYAELNFRKEA